MIDWKPMSTAPKDGRVILAWDRGKNVARIIYWDKEKMLSEPEQHPCFGDVKGTGIMRFWRVVECFSARGIGSYCAHAYHGGTWENCPLGKQNSNYEEYVKWANEEVGWVDAVTENEIDESDLACWAEITRPEVTDD